MATAIPTQSESEDFSKLDVPVQEPSLCRSQIFEVLSNDRRQYVIRCLLERCEEGTLPLGEVVDYVAGRENDVPVRELDAAQRKRVYTALRQCHLPKLDEYGVVDYDNLRSQVAIGDAIDDVQRYLDYDPDAAAPWSGCYLGLSVVAVLAALLSMAGVPPLGTLSDGILIVVIAGAFTITAGAHSCRLEQPSLLDRISWYR